MSNYEEAEQGNTGSGLYRRLRSSLLPVVASVLFLVLSGWMASLWQDSRDHEARLNRLEERLSNEVVNNAQFREYIKTEFKEMKDDIKELLRETRR